MTVTVVGFAENKQTLDFIHTLRLRAEAVERGVVYSSAEFVLNYIKGVLGGAKYKEYVTSLKLVEVAAGVPAYAIYAKPKRQKLSKLDVATAVLYIRPKARRSVKVPEYVGVLARHSPWTFTTIPFIPRRQEATIVYRRVRENEVTAIAEKRGKDRPEWMRALTKLGKVSEKPLVVPPKLKAVPDLGFEALRIEMGLGTGAGRSHWRPAFRSLAKGGLQGMLASASPVVSPLIKVGSVGQLSLPSVEGTISVTMMATFRGFQSRLRVRNM